MSQQDLVTKQDLELTTEGCGRKWLTLSEDGGQQRGEPQKDGGQVTESEKRVTERIDKGTNKVLGAMAIATTLISIVAAVAVALD